MGAAAFGALVGFSLTVMVGRQDLWVLIGSAALLLCASLYLTQETLTDALRRNARGCATAAVLLGAALIAWPMACLLAPLQAGIFWLAPASAVLSLVLFASCWSGPPKAVYRTAVKGALIAALAAHQGVLLVMGG